MIKIIIPGKPIAKKRPRFARHGKFVVTYNSQETEEGRFLWEVKRQWKGDPLEGGLFLKVYFSMPIPKGTSKKNLEKMSKGLILHTKKPDLDNLIKFSKDCLNGIAWKDDSQVVKIEAIKDYGLEPKTEIWIDDLKLL